MSNLRKQIENLNESMMSQVPQDTLAVFQQSIADLKNEQIESKSMKVGEILPLFSLENNNGELVALEALLEKNDKVILAFFRGMWCPYCSLELKALQNQLNEIIDKKAQLIAISPQKVSLNAETSENLNLQFEVLTDTDNAYAKQLGISFMLQDYALPHYRAMGIDLSYFNGNDANELPMPAVFVVNKKREVIYSFVDANYMNRIDIEELIAVL